MTADDVVRFKCHDGLRVKALHSTGLMKKRPLRMLRGLLHRLDAGLIGFERAEPNSPDAQYVHAPGYGMRVGVNAFPTVNGENMPGFDKLDIGRLPWRPETLRRTDGLPAARYQDWLCRDWLGTGLCCGRGAYTDAWLAPDGAIVLVDLDGQGDPAFVEAVWHAPETG